MEAVQEGIDTLANLEERITRAVQTITQLRTENGRLEDQLKSAQQRLKAAQSELDETSALSAEFQKENGTLEAQLAQLTQETEAMRNERKQVKTRIERLLSQLDLLNAS